MRRRCQVVLVALPFAWTVGCQSSNVPAKPGAAAPLERRVYEVLGMDGPGRHADLETRVKKLEPVQEAQADVQAGELTVFVRSDVALDDQDVFEAIRRCSFSPGRRLE